MPLKSTLCSKRAQKLVALCENESSLTTFKLSSPVSSCSTISPVSSWWDNIFEASDIIQPSSRMNFPSERNVNSVKRKLCFSPVKVSDDTQCETPADPSKLPLTSKDNILHEFPVAASKLCLTPSDNIPCKSSPTVSKLPSTFNDTKCETDRLDVAEVLSHSCETGSGNNSSKKLTHQAEGLDLKQTDVSKAVPSLSDCGDTKSGLQLLYPSQIKIMAARLALHAGIEHFTIKGNLKKARSLKPSCKESCNRCAIPKLSQSERLQVNNEFWALKDHVKQWLKCSVLCHSKK